MAQWHNRGTAKCLKYENLHGHVLCSESWARCLAFFSFSSCPHCSPWVLAVARDPGEMMVRYLSAFVALAIMAVACSESDGTSASGGVVSASGGVVSASGGVVSSTGGIANTGGSGGVAAGDCQFDSECPALGCYMCPASYCVNGKCVWGGSPSYGGASSGGGGNAGSGGSSAAGSGGSEADGGAVACGSTTCNADELCVHNVCINGGPVRCQPRDASGECPNGWQFDTSCTQIPGGGCSPLPCTNPPPYCAPVPSTCTTVPTETTGCGCADSVCRFGACRVVTSKRTVMCDAV
jgi:hypothetical protein